MTAPAAAEVAVRALLRAHTETAAIADHALRPIEGGLSNDAWRGTLADGVGCFVRRARRDVERLGADHAAECRVLELVAPAGLAPAVIRCEPRAGLLVTRWVDGEVGLSAASGPRLHAMAVALARLHALTVAPDLRRVDFAQQARALGEALDDTDARELHGTAMRVIEALERSQTGEALCHHDLNPLNVVFGHDGRPWLVDWEYAGLGDPVYDLASFASQHRCTARQRARLVASYTAAGGVVDPTRLEPANWAFDYVQWLWYRRALEGAAPTDADRDLMARRVRRLGTGLRVRATRLLRCNNASFDNES